MVRAVRRACGRMLERCGPRSGTWSVEGVRSPCTFFFFSSRRRHTRFDCDWSSDVCSSDLVSGQLTVTIGKFYRVTGESTQHHGVEPDVPLPSAIDMKEVGESALEAALP